MLLTGLLPLSLLGLVSYTRQDHLLPGDGTSHSGLDPPTLIISQENAPQVCPLVNRTKAGKNWTLVSPLMALPHFLPLGPTS